MPEATGEHGGARDRPRIRPLWPYTWPGLTLLIGLAVTAGLTVAAQLLYTHNEKRLLGLRVKEAAQVVSTSLPIVQTPLASAAALADATNGNRKKFRKFISPYVGPSPARPFVSVSLWKLNAVGHGPKAVSGAYPRVRPPTARVFLKQADMTDQLSVLPMLSGPAPRVGYALTAHGASHYAAYGEAAIPIRRYAPPPVNSAFSDLSYALYLGPAQPQNLLFTDVPRLPLKGHQDTARIPFGNASISLVMSARKPLGGGLPRALPWIILGAGALLSLFTSLLMLSISRGRESARRLARTLENVAAENRRLYGEQRDIAQTLQHSLLPEELPPLSGADASALYQAGEQGVEIGGDWYDVIALDDERVLMVVGDVSGRGLRAATTMASLRHGIHAYAAENESPATILSKLSKLMSVSDDGKLATVMCAVLRISQHKVTLASAGHLPPLLIEPDGGRFLEGPVGPPIGMERGAIYHAKTFSIPAGATLLGFTDGLVERRGESLDRGLARLRETATADHLPLPDLLESLLTQLRGTPSEDDTAIVGVRWRV